MICSLISMIFSLFLGQYIFKYLGLKLKVNHFIFVPSLSWFPCLNASDTWRILGKLGNLASGSSYFLNWVQLIKIFPIQHGNNTSCLERSLEIHTKAGNLHPSTCSSICSLSYFLSLMEGIRIMQESLRNRQWSWCRCKCMNQSSELIRQM